MYGLHQGAAVTDSVLGGTAGRAAALITALLTLFGPCFRFDVLHERTGAVNATANKTEDVFPRYSETATSWSVGRSVILSSFGDGVVFRRFPLFIEGRSGASCVSKKEVLENLAHNDSSRRAHLPTGNLSASGLLRSRHFHNEGYGRWWSCDSG